MLNTFKRKRSIKPTKTGEDDQLALARLEIIFDSKKGTTKGDELEILGMLVDHYENVAEQK